MKQQLPFQCRRAGDIAIRAAPPPHQSIFQHIRAGDLASNAAPCHTLICYYNYQHHMHLRYLALEHSIAATTTSTIHNRSNYNATSYRRVSTRKDTTTGIPTDDTTIGQPIGDLAPAQRAGEGPDTGTLTGVCVPGFFVPVLTLGFCLSPPYASINGRALCVRPVDRYHSDEREHLEHILPDGSLPGYDYYCANNKSQSDAILITFDQWNYLRCHHRQYDNHTTIIRAVAKYKHISMDTDGYTPPASNNAISTHHLTQTGLPTPMMQQ